MRATTGSAPLLLPKAAFVRPFLLGRPEWGLAHWAASSVKGLAKPTKDLFPGGEPPAAAWQREHLNGKSTRTSGFGQRLARGEAHQSGGVGGRQNGTIRYAHSEWGRLPTMRYRMVWGGIRGTRHARCAPSCKLDPV